MDTRNSLWWDRQLEAGLPDSRLTGPERERTIVHRWGQRWERCFCADCGKSGGMVTASDMPHVFYVCFECNEKLLKALGPVPMDELPPERVRE